MGQRTIDLIPLLDHIDPDAAYDTWVRVGMALKHEGYPVESWEAWSRRGAKFHEGECRKKWDSFNGDGEPVTGATITTLAKAGGWTPTEGTPNDNAGTPEKVFNWDSVLTEEDIARATAATQPQPAPMRQGQTTQSPPPAPSSDPAPDVLNSLEPVELPEKLPPFVEPDSWDAAADAIKYIKALYHSTDNVAVCGSVTTWQTLTAGEIVRKLEEERARGVSSFEPSMLGVTGYQQENGAWVVINPTDEKGRKDANIKEYRYTLIESDEMPLERQRAYLDALHLPIAALTYSGGKSLHAVVRIEAKTKEEYSKRVTFLFDYCRKRGFIVDQANKNPSRLTRLAGVRRGAHRQFLISTNTGAASWDEWYSQAQDGLPFFDAVPAEKPALKPALIIGEEGEGILRAGGLMLFLGDSKAGKSWAMIELANAFSYGGEWFGQRCMHVHVLYINLELDRAECFSRFYAIAEKLGTPYPPANVAVWNLRGILPSIERLRGSLKTRLKKGQFDAIILDPIYIVMDGDENSAHDVKEFFRIVLKCARETGAALIGAHHYSKGVQGGKRDIDRGSGSGVYARIPDARVTMTRLEVTDEETGEEVDAFRVEFSGRFPKVKPLGVYFEAPLHIVDRDGFLDLAMVEGGQKVNSMRGNEVKHTKMVENVLQAKAMIENRLRAGEAITTHDIMEALGVEKTTVSTYLKRINEEYGTHYAVKRGVKSKGEIVDKQAAEKAG